MILLACRLSVGLALPPSQEVAQRHQAHLVQMKQVLAGPETDDRKFDRLAEAIRKEPNADFRRDLLALAAGWPGPAQESFLIDQLRNDDDFTVRSEAASLLGQFGSEKSIAALAKAAAEDEVTKGQRVCIGMEGTARRKSIFALAELGRRLPDSAQAIAEELRKLPEADHTEIRLSNETLGDARRQALFQLTNDLTLLKPFFERLKSHDAKTRVRGVTAFRFLNVSTAPDELLELARDPDPMVCSWVMLVLGEIGDAKTTDLLIEKVEDASLDNAVRVNAIMSLGRMRVADAQPLLESLLSDEDLKVNAAIALSQITGKRHPLVPEGYGGSNWPGDETQ